ncbi:MAG TPA: glycosyltransferase family 4 protein [Steroidobacteraceae bacterium]|nr:glycosyltransferase family 4 protein [Steroidobacteraceae bacterium]
MKIALVVPGGVDRSGECRVIPALLALIARLSVRDEIHVFALAQEPEPACWELLGARIHNVGAAHSRVRAIQAICAEHRSSPFHLVHSIWSGAPGLVAVAAARILRLPSLIHVAGGELVALPEIGYGGRLGWKGRMREALVLRAATVVSAASDPMVAALAQLGISARRVPLGVDVKLWPPRAPVRRDPAKPARLLHVASLNRVKDQTTLLHALASLQHSGVPFEMDIVGEDTLQGEIQAMAHQSGLAGSVRFHGFLPQRRLLPLLQDAHLLVMSSRHEAGPLAVLEAAGQGVPTIGTAVGHIAEWAPDAAGAVPVGDWSALAGAITEMLADESLRLRVAREALRRAVREDADFTARAFQALYTSVAAPGNAHRNVRGSGVCS